MAPSSVAGGDRAPAEGEEEAQEFVAFNAVLAGRMLDEADELGARAAPCLRDWVARMHAYTTAGGKMNRGLAVLQAARVLGAKEDAAGVTRRTWERWATVGAAIEWLQASFLIADDIMDRSTSRRGRPCWYLSAGAVAINDAFILQSLMHRAIRSAFAEEPVVHARLIDLFAEVRLQTELGQLLDLLTAPSCADGPSLIAGDAGVTAARTAGAPFSFKGFTLQTYATIVRMKTAHYSFRLPVLAAVAATGACVAPAALAQAEEALLALGDHFQVQDDYLDVYGDPAVTGKIGTDIEEGKCSWLIVQALESPLLTAEQREVLAACYGCEDPEAAARVRTVYEALDLRSVFLAYQTERERALCEQISAIPDMRLAALVSCFAGRIYSRRR